MVACGSRLHGVCSDDIMSQNLTPFESLYQNSKAGLFHGPNFVMTVKKKKKKKKLWHYQKNK